MTDDPIGAGVLDAHRLEMKCIDWSGRSARGIGCLVHGSALFGPVGVSAAAIVGQAVDVRSESRLGPIFVQLAEISVEAPVLFRDENDVIDSRDISWIRGLSHL